MPRTPPSRILSNDIINANHNYGLLDNDIVSVGLSGG